MSEELDTTLYLSQYFCVHIKRLTKPKYNLSCQGWIPRFHPPKTAQKE